MSRINGVHFVTHGRRRGELRARKVGCNRQITQIAPKVHITPKADYIFRKRTMNLEAFERPRCGHVDLQRPYASDRIEELENCGYISKYWLLYIHGLQ